MPCTAPPPPPPPPPRAWLLRVPLNNPRSPTTHAAPPRSAAGYGWPITIDQEGTYRRVNGSFVPPIVHQYDRAFEATKVQPSLTSSLPALLIAATIIDHSVLMIAVLLGGAPWWRHHGWRTSGVSHCCAAVPAWERGDTQRGLERPGVQLLAAWCA